MLAKAAAVVDDRAAVERYASLILDRTLRNLSTLRLKFDEALGKRDFASMTQIASALLRQDSVYPGANYVMAQLIMLSPDPEARPMISALVAEPSVWRPKFLELLASQGPTEPFPDIMTAIPTDATESAGSSLDGLFPASGQVWPEQAGLCALGRAPDARGSLQRRAS